MRFTKKEIFTWSNALSFLRLLISFPAFLLISGIPENFYYRYYLIILLFIAAATDFFDGFLARKFNEITEFGKIIDPIADKVLIAVLIIQLFLIGEISEFYFYIVIIRDLLIFLAGLYITNKIDKVLPSNMLGKITVTFIAFFILAIILNLETQLPIIYTILYYSSVILIFASLIGYAIRGYEVITWHKNKKLRNENGLI